MDLRSLEFPNRLSPQSTATSARRKVISRLILGLVASFSVLSLVFLNLWLKDSPALQGFNAYFPKATVSCNRSSSSITCILDHSMLLNGTVNGHETVRLPDLKGSTEAEIDESHGKNGNFTMLEKYDVSSVQGNVVIVDTEIDESHGKSRNITNISAGQGNVVVVETEIGELHGKDGNFTMLGKHKISSAEGNEVLVAAEELKSEHFQVKGDDIRKKMSRDCDLYKGRWVRDGSKPLYPQGSCPYVDGRFNCYRNKRPDGDFLKWRWKPYDCEMPSLNGTDFLERLRGQKLVFVGDSINRNMWESLVCILRHSLPNKRRIYESRKKGLYAYYRFEDYKCTVGFVVSPFLVRESSFNGENDTSFETLRLDLMDKTTGIYQDANILIFNTGHWWSHEKTRKGVDYYQEGDNLYKRMRLLTAYTKALGTWSRWIDANINREKTQVIFRGYSVKHFWGGPWNSGGHCHEHTQPIFNETHLAKYPPIMQALEHVIHKMKTPVVYLNITRLADFRKDGHPSIYRRVYKTVEDKQAAVLSQDCSHWCLPGVPDTWNELLYASLLQTGRGSWRN